MTDPTTLALHDGDRIIRQSLARWLGDETLLEAPDLVAALAGHIEDLLVRRRMVRQLDELAEVIATRPASWSGEATATSVIRALHNGVPDLVGTFLTDIAQEPIPASEVATEEEPRSAYFEHLSRRLGPPPHFVEPVLAGGHRLSGILSEERAVALVGGPGTGKTWALRWLAMRAIQQQDGPIPVYVRLRDWTPGLTALDSVVLSASCPREQADWLRRTLQEGNVLVLLDGLDEALDQHHVSILRQLEELLVDNPRGRCVITSRDPSNGRLVLPRGFTDVSLDRMSSTDIGNFVRAWRWRRPFDVSSPPVHTLLTAIRSSPRLSLLAGNRMLCATLCELYQRRGAVLPGDGDLRGALLDLLLEPSPTPVPGDRPEPLSQREKLALLRKSTTTPSSLGARTDDERARFEFAHATFQEYLTAQATRTVTIGVIPDGPPLVTLPNPYAVFNLVMSACTEAAAHLDDHEIDTVSGIPGARIRLRVAPDRLVDFLERLHRALHSRASQAVPMKVAVISGTDDHTLDLLLRPDDRDASKRPRASESVTWRMTGQFYREMLWWQGVPWAENFRETNIGGLASEGGIWTGVVGAVRHLGNVINADLPAVADTGDRRIQF